MAKPALYVFSISHYCEKARWALDASGIAYRLRPIAPGFHRKQAKKFGLKGSGLPYLHTGGSTIHGSPEIIDWAEQQSGNSLTPSANARAIEARLDGDLGVHIRRYYYSEAMIKYPETVQPIFKKNLPLLERFVVEKKWDMIRDLMIKGLGLSPENGAKSREIILREMDWLDGLLSDGRTFLAGGQFSRADIAAASLLAPLANPAQHPEYTALSLPPDVQADVDTWAARPCMRYVHNMYANHR